jgi:anti-sigma B factor antagonist
VRGEHGLDLVRHDAETCTTLVLDGDIDACSAPLVQQAVAAAFRDGAGDVVLDLRHVAFVDSSGLGVLIACHKRARHESCRLVLRAPSPRVARLLAVTTLDRVLSVEPESDVT